MTDQIEPDIQPEDTAPRTPQSELDQCRQQAEEYLNGWKRAKADYANLQKETERQRMEFVQYATESLIRDLLPLVEHFDQAFAHLPEDLKQSDWVTGVRHIHSGILGLLQARGVTEVNPVGEAFDPMKHEAVESVESDQPPGTIIEVVKKGYQLHGKVLFPARVKVSA